ncbi:O-antigen repeat-containing transporter [Planococcus antarcticus DSM 14505]|uniref:Lipopolysaccharide biosynthesis protein n=1 Tax=Planococcus antarcticus DSM 14505 TaxID=1185653 RepID=A0A1C7DFE3_9BACL|nr:lipopolysaccharide biosynthesis protein [Planococcus antarcticus]ANU10175.1 lipopolysaccharide biosynthesis protein [Planococcus antarcticus DSM 14505]EIM06124.1 O-antigen repeat-containing transporter [Planococcus antarcticus DSM 14505]
MEPQPSLKKKTIGGLLWSFGDLIGNQGIQFLIQIILARLLLPEHFGLIGMILVFIALSNSLVDSGFTQALIRERNASQTDYSTIFYFNLLISVLIYVILYAAAPSISRFFDEPQLVSLLRLLSIGIVINAFAIIPKAMFAKEVNFKAQAKINLSSSILSGVIAVVLAVAGYGVWSLVLRQLSMNAIQSLLFAISKKWIPSLVFSIASFKRLFGFGWKLLVSGLIDTFYTNVYFLIIGRQYSAAQLGYYTNASRFSEIISQNLAATILRVTYPVLSSIQDEHERLKQSYKSITKLAAFLIFPVMVGMAAVGEPLVMLVFGEKWLQMIPYFQLLSIAGMLYPILALDLSLLQVKGRSDLYLLLEIINKISLTILLFLAVWLELGVIGLITAAILNTYLEFFVNSHFSKREVSYPAKEKVRDLLPIYLLSFLMGAVVWMLGLLVDTTIVIQLLLQVTIGMLFYIAACRVANIAELKTVYGLILSLLKKVRER